MHRLELHEMFAGVPADQREELLPDTYYIETDSGEADLWPSAAGMATTLSTIESTQDALEALAHFNSLQRCDAGIVDQQEWEDEIMAVVGELMAAGAEHDRLAGAGAN